jgi:hypothetical protein
MTLDEDVAAQIRRVMRERGIGWKEAVNELLRLGLQSTRTPEPYESPTFASGVHPGVDLTKALRLAGELADDEVVRKVETGN